MKSSLSALLLAAMTLAPATALATDTKPEPAKEAVSTAKDYTVIKVNNEEIKNSEVLDLWKSLFPGGGAPDFNSFDENIRQNVLRGMISERLIYNEAAKAGVDKDPEVQKRIAAVQKQVIMQSFMEKKAKDLVTDADLKAAYNEKVAAAKGQEEVKAKHILVPTEEEAKKLYDQIQKGADFDKLAKEKSTDKGSGANGGELGWFTKDKMVPEFAAAAFKLKKGEVSPPVKSEFGWHIIKLEDRRPLQVPGFDEMKDQLREQVAQKAMQTYVEGLLKNADIKYYAADGKEKPFPVLPPSKAAAEKPAAGKASMENKQ